MKVKMIFNLPEDDEDFKIAANASRMNVTLYELDQWLRSKTKYADDNLSKDKYDAYQECRDKLHELLRENNIEL